MTAVLTAPLASAAITANTTPTLGTINRYNASGGALVVTLPALSGLNAGANLMVQKDTLDASGNTITFNTAGSDEFDDGTSSVVLDRPGYGVTMQAVQISSVTYWKITNYSLPASAIDPLTGTTINLASNTLTGTLAEFNTALSDGDFVSRTGVEILSNKTFNDGTNTFLMYHNDLTLVEVVDVTKRAQFVVPSGQAASTTRTHTLPTVNSVLVGRDTTDDLTNKRVVPRVLTNVSASFVTPDNANDGYVFTALAANLTINNFADFPSPPGDMQKIMFRIKDDGTPRTLTWSSDYISSGIATLPITTQAGKTHLIGLIYDATADKWVCMAVDAVGY